MAVRPLLWTRMAFAIGPRSRQPKFVGISRDGVWAMCADVWGATP
jgi:hypothetical protein